MLSRLKAGACKPGMLSFWRGRELWHDYAVARIDRIGAFRCDSVGTPPSAFTWTR